MASAPHVATLSTRRLLARRRGLPRPRAGTGFAADWAVNTDHLSVNFAVSHFDISHVHGRFGKIAATVQFDPDAKTGLVVVTVDADSIDTGNRSIDDGVLRSDQFLDAAANPGNPVCR